MIKSKGMIILLSIPFLVLAGWMSYALHFVRNAQEVVLPVQGYDPRNILSGHYIRFQIKWEQADCFQLDWNGVCPYKDFAEVDSYYVPENRARDLERKLNSSDYLAEIVFAYQPGVRPIAKEFRINGQTVLYSR